MSDSNGGEGRGVGSGDPETDPLFKSKVPTPLRPGDPNYEGKGVDPGLGNPEGPGTN